MSNVNNIGLQGYRDYKSDFVTQTQYLNLTIHKFINTKIYHSVNLFIYYSIHKSIHYKHVKGSVTVI